MRKKPLLKYVDLAWMDGFSSKERVLCLGAKSSFNSVQGLFLAGRKLKSWQGCVCGGPLCSLLSVLVTLSSFRVSRQHDGVKSV